MSKFSKASAAVLVSAGMILSAGASFAAAPVFTTAAPNNGMAIDAFTSQLANFNKQEVVDLVGAKTVSVVKYDTAWSDGGDSQKALKALGNDAQSINLLRKAIKSNPAALKLLEANKIVINDVVDIVSDGHGAVQVYIS